MATARKKTKSACGGSRKRKTRTGGSFIIKVRPETKRKKNKKK